MPFDRAAMPQTFDLLRDFGFQFREARGKWRTTTCEFHDDHSPSMRVNVETGGWCCMSCGASGGDAVAYLMARTGGDFVNCAKALGAWRGGPDDRAARPRLPGGLSAHDALSVIAADMGLLFVVAADVAAGKTISEFDIHEFARATGRMQAIAKRYG